MSDPSLQTGKMLEMLPYQPVFVGWMASVHGTETAIHMPEACSFFESRPTPKVDAMVDHFVRFEKEEREMPVIWHQSLLAFVQR